MRCSQLPHPEDGTWAAAADLGLRFPQRRGRAPLSNLPSSRLPSVGYTATGKGIYSVWLLDSFVHHVAKVTERGFFFFLVRIPISSLSLEKATPVVSGMSDDTAVFLIRYTGKFRALSH